VAESTRDIVCPRCDGDGRIDVPRALSARLRHERERLGLSLRDAAKASGVGFNVIANAEKGVSNPRFRDVMRLLCLYDVRAEEIVLERARG